MRIWHYELLPYLPDLQFKGQYRELVAIMRDWRDKGATNHILINRVMEYGKNHLTSYFLMYAKEYESRYGKSLETVAREFVAFASGEPFVAKPFDGWHNRDYLRVCVANIYEKYHFGIGKSRPTDEEWKRLLAGYKEITGVDWQI